MTLLAWVLAVPAVVLLGWFSLEVFAGLRVLPTTAHLPGQPPRTTVLIPAHNEAAGITETLRQLTSANPALNILVVADNCSDDTAACARASGAQVIERNDPLHRGKGFALAFGRGHLAQRPAAERPEVVVVLDADCRSDAASIERLARSCAQHAGPMQARNLLSPAPAKHETAALSPLSQISNFAMLLKNLVRARGLQRIGGGIPLFGTGMAFPWPLFAEVELATDHLVEDMQLALDLARAGVVVRLEENASVESAPAPDAAMAAQRGRWERGFIGTALSQGLPMLLGGIAAGSRHRAALGMHLLVPPFALLLMLAGTLFVATLLLGFVGAGWQPAAAPLVALLAALGAVVAAWRREGRSTLSTRAALGAPFYLLWKVPLYLGFLKKDRAGWTRTQRAGESE